MALRLLRLDGLTGLALFSASDPACVKVARQMDAFASLTARAVRTTVLASKALALTWLGVTDIYQGSEVTRTSLVDPDNRRAAAKIGRASCRERV